MECYMTSTQHTPGPWKPRRPESNTGNVPVKAGDVTVAIAVCADWGYEHAPDRSTAGINARRLCAAVNACQGIRTEALEQGVIGELLEALQTASAWIDDHLFVPRLEIQTKVRSAIAKATGGGQ
jgi:hypothetical protein